MAKFHHVTNNVLNLLCSAVCPLPGRGADAKFVLFILLCDKKRAASGVTIGHCPLLHRVRWVAESGSYSIVGTILLYQYTVLRIW